MIFQSVAIMILGFTGYWIVLNGGHDARAQKLDQK
jgi:hypothetical protein